MLEKLQYPGFNTYRRSDIKAELTEEEFENFNQWMTGQTCPVAEDDRAEPFDLVYCWDYERWAAGDYRIWD